MVKCFANNKAWITKDLKVLLNRKKECLASKNREQLKLVQKEINTQIRISKYKYKVKVENMFKGDTKLAWNGIKQLTGMKNSTVTPDVKNVDDFCENLNVFYTRFDKYDFSAVRSCILEFHRDINSTVKITEEDVIKCLKAIKPNKASGPDNIGGNVLKLCRESLAKILCNIFQQSLDNVKIPVLWKTSEIIPIPKKASPSCNNDYRPVALTSIMMKCLEKIVKNILCEQVKGHTDPYQFAYTKNRCVEDATLCLIDYVLKHVDKSNTADHKHFTKILFIDFSSAFNTIQPHIMMQKLQTMHVNSNLILWINEFLTNRFQYVKFLGGTSNTRVTNTGAPQGCVLSPLLFTLYTADCRCISETCQLFKYADDTALVSQCINDDVSYRDEVKRFINWCSDNYLDLNVSKTKQLIVDFRTSETIDTPLLINDVAVEDVKEYKYLGTIIDNSFTFSTNIDSLYNKLRSRLYFVRQMRNLNMDSKIMELFYKSIIQSVIVFSITCWYGNGTSSSKSKISKIINNCIRLGITDIPTLLELFKTNALHRYHVISKDDTHPLHNSFQLLPSGRRLRSFRCRTARYSRSFVPTCIRIINGMGINV